MADSTNPYDSLVQQDTAQQLRVSMMDAVSKAPDTEAKLQTLAKSYNMPVDAVRLRQPEIEHQARLDAVDYDTLAQHYPKTSNVLMNPQNAAIAHDDVGNMSELEYWAKYLFSHPDAKNTLMGDAGALLHQFNRGAAGTFQAVSETAAVPFDFLEQFTGMGGNPLRRLSEGFAQMGAQSAKRAQELSPPQADIVRSGVSSGIQSFGQNAMLLPLALLPGGQVPALLGMASLQGGQSYQEAREAGVGQWQALAHGTSQAVIEYATEKLPLHKLLGDVAEGTPLFKTLLHNAALEIPGEQVATVLQDLNDWATLHPEKPFSDYLAERPSAAAQTLIATLIGVGGNVTLTHAMQRAADNAAGTERVAKQAEARANVIDQMVKLAEASKVRERDPSKFAEFAQSLVEQDLPHIYIDAKTLLKSTDINQVAMALPSVAEQISEAAATGGDVVIPTQELLTAGPGNEFMQSLIDNARTAPEAMSPVEARTYMQEHGDQIKADIEKVLNQQEQDGQWRTMRDQVRDEFKSQLEQAKRFTNDVNNQYATLLANFYSVTAAKLGVTPQELVQRYPLQIRADGVAGGQVLDQGEAQPRDLIVAHNLTTDNLRHANEIGGLPAPSLAITKVHAPIQGFGEITLLGDTKLASPSGKNPVFNADVYSPRFPDVKAKVDDRMVVRALEPLYGAAQDAGLYAKDPSGVVGEMSRNRLERAIGDVVHDVGMRYGYATKVLGKTIEVPTKEEPGRAAETGRGIVDVEPLASYLKTIDLGSITKDSPDADKVAHDLMEKAMIATVNLQGQKHGLERAVFLANRLGKMWGEGEKTDIDLGDGDPKLVLHVPARMTSEGVYQLYKMATRELAPGAAARQVTDTAKLAEVLDGAIDNEAMAKWVREQLAPAMGERRIDKGNGKTAAYTLQNLVKHMTGKVRDAEGFNYGLGNARSKGATSFKTLGEVQAQRDQVQSKAEADAAIKENEDRFQELITKVAVFNPQEQERYGRHTWELLPDVIGESYQQGVARALQANGFKNVPASLVAELEQFAKGLVALPTEYFEAKPQRAVGINEFKGAAIPHNTPEDVRAMLVDMGLDLVEYQKGDEASRAQAVQRLAQLLDSRTGDVLFQQARGSITLPEDLTKTPTIISLFKGADLSTFIHESGHFFLEVQADLAARIQAQINAGASVTEGEREIVADMDKVLAWFGVKGSESRSPLDTWLTMPLEEKRPFHEQWARGFEAYAFEGNAPSVELQGMFQKFRAWMLAVYKELKALRVTLTDDVRGVMDRMLASTQAIQEAEAARRLGPLFKTAEEAGMSLDEFKAYHALATEASQAAIDELQARGLRDMQWLARAKDKKLKEMQKTHDSLRKEVEREVRAEVMSQPVYRAWQFLTGKGEAPLEVTPAQQAYKTKLSEWTQERADVELDAREAEKAALRSAHPEVAGIAFGQLLAKNKKQIDLNVAQAMLEWEQDNPKPVAPKAPEPEQRGPLEAGVGKLNTTTLAEVYGSKTDAPWRKLQGLKMTSPTGLHPDVVGEAFGFTSGDELVKALINAEPPASVIEGMTDQRMLERYGDLGTPEGIARAADRAIHNDVRARFVASEIKALEAGNKVKAPGLTGRATVDVLATAARQQAERVIGGTKVRDVRPSQYTAAEARAARNAERAMVKGDTQEALAEKRHQIINLQAAKEAMRAQDEIERTIKYLAKFADKPKGLDAEYYDQINALLERFDLRKGTSLAEVDKRKTLQAWVESQREQGMEPEVPPELLNEAYRTSYKDLTVDELRGLRDTVKQIEHLGRLKNKLLTAKAAREFAAIRDEIADSITLHAGDRKADTRTPATTLGRALKTVKDFGAAHIKAATLARILDGGKDGGPVWEYLVRSANERGDMETTERAKATEALHNILQPVLKGGKLGGKGQFFPSINRSMNREQVLAMALNMGNDGNIQRMLGGEGWTIQQVEPVLATLTAADWRAVQAIWDHFETYRPQIAAKERRVYGKEPDWVQAVPLTVNTSDGQTVNLKGGYYPIKYDPLASNRAEQHNDAEAAKRQLQGAYTSATTRRGFTKSRVEEVKGRPLLYSLSGVYSGVNDVIHDLAWHEWLIDANKILRSDKIDSAIREHYGPQAVRQFKTWVQDVAAGEAGLQAELDGALGKLRHGVSIAGLGFNVMSAVMQPLGLSQSIVRVGAPWIGKGLAQYIASPVGKTREVNSKSEFMAGRARTRFRELNELRNQVEGQHPAREVLGRYAYFLMMRCQQMVDTPTWLGAYEKAISQGNDEDRARALADQAVIDAQGGGQTKDLAAIERGGPAQKLFTVFYSFMNTALNIGVAQGMTEKSAAKKAADMLMLYSVPAVLGAILKDALTPGDSGDWDDWDKAMRRLLSEQLSYLFGLFVIAREFGQAALISAGLVDRARDYSGPAGLRLVADTYTLGKQVSQGEFDDSFRKALVNELGDLLGLPSAQVNRTITGAEALSDGQTDNPAALVFGYQQPH